MTETIKRIEEIDSKLLKYAILKLMFLGFHPTLNTTGDFLRAIVEMADIIEEEAEEAELWDTDEEA